MGSSSSGFMTSRLIVETDSPGWHKSIIKLLSIVEGASYRIDAQQGYAYISGKVDRGDFLKMVAKLKEHIQLYHMEYDYGYQGHAHNQQHSATSSDAKSPDRQKPGDTKNHKRSKPSCCTLM